MPVLTADSSETPPRCCKITIM